MRRRRVALTAATAGLAVVAVPASAAWFASGGGAGTASARTLAAPGAVTATTTATSAALSWGAAAPMPSGSVGYLVERAPFGSSSWAAACGGAAVAATTCTDTGLTASTDYTYRVTSVYATWRQTGAPSGKVTTAAAPAPASRTLAFLGCPTAPVGRNAEIAVSVQLLDAQGQPTQSGAGGVLVTLVSSNTGAASVSPGSLTVPAGSTTSGTVTIRTTTSNNAADRSSVVTASAPGFTSGTCTVTKTSG